MASRSVRKANTTDRGLGYRHRQQVERLKRLHVDGTPCWWDGRPMYLDSEQNWDGLSLAGDHSLPRAQGNTGLCDRLLHGRCNSERGDGYHDHLRPALTGHAVRVEDANDITALAMPWPQ